MNIFYDIEGRQRRAEREREAQKFRMAQNIREGRSPNLKQTLGRQMVKLGERLQS